MSKIWEEVWNEGREEGREEGRAEGEARGRAEEQKTTALFLLEAGKYALEEISAITRLSLDEVRQLQTGLG